MKTVICILIFTAIHLNGAVRKEQSSENRVCLTFINQNKLEEKIEIDSLSYLNGYRLKSEAGMEDSLSRRAFLSMDPPDKKIVLTIGKNQRKEFRKFAEENNGAEIEIFFGHDQISQGIMFLPIKSGTSYIFFVAEAVDRDEVVSALRDLLPEKPFTTQATQTIQ